MYDASETDVRHANVEDVQRKNSDLSMHALFCFRFSSLQFSMTSTSEPEYEQCVVLSHFEHVFCFPRSMTFISYPVIHVDKFQEWSLVMFFWQHTERADTTICYDFFPFIVYPIEWNCVEDLINIIIIFILNWIFCKGPLPAAPPRVCSVSYFSISGTGVFLCDLPRNILSWLLWTLSLNVCEVYDSCRLFSPIRAKLCDCAGIGGRNLFVAEEADWTCYLTC